MVGRVLSHYRILEQIGSGGMGEVYLAEDLRLHRRVALKVLSEVSRASVTRSARFEREMKAIAAINHPNVVTLYDVDEADGQRFLAMEVVEGDTLADKLPPGEKLQLPRFLDIAIPLVDGLRAAHALGIAHRDLKPRNVMIDREGRVKLLDFGLAAWRQAGGGDANRDLTLTGAIVGTPAYLSPEQICDEPVDPRSDLFQLGVLFYELLAGRRPFGGATPSELTSSILRDSPEPLSALRPDLPERVGTIVHRCLEKRAGDRWQSAQEVLAALRELELESQVQRITGQLHTSGQRRRRRLVAIGWAAAVIGAVVGVSAGIWWRGRSVGPQLEPHVVPMVTWSGLQSDAQLSPDGEWVSFLDSGFGPGDAFLQRVEDGRPQRLSEGASTTIGHVWSADGERVALLVENESRYLVQIFRPLAGTAERILPLPEGQVFQRLVRWWGSLLYLEGDGGLFSLDLESGNQKLVLSRDESGGRASHFDVSADSKRAVFSLSREGRTTAHLIELPAGEPKSLTLHAGNDYFPRWLGPGSDTVVVRSDRGGRKDLWLVPVAAPRQARALLFGSWDEEIDFASQTSRIATFRESARDTDLHLYDPVASPEVSPVTTGAASSGAPGVSLQGDVVVYQESDPRLARTLYPFGSRVVVARLVPGELISERQELGEGAQPILSPGGRRVAFFRKLERGVALVVHELSTHYEQRVTDSFAFPGLALATYEPDARNAAWESDDALWFVVRAEGSGWELRRWSVSDDSASSVALHAAAAPKALADVVPGSPGVPGLVLEWPSAGEAVYTEPGPHVFQVWEVGGAPGAERLGSAVLARVETGTGETLRLLGRRGEDAVLVAARRNSDWSYRLRIVLAGTTAAVEHGVIERAVSTSVTFDPDADRVLFSGKDPRDGVYNLFEHSLANGERRQLTFNRRPGVLFSDIVALPERRILLSVTALTSTINMLELREVRSQSGGRDGGRGDVAPEA